MVEKALKDVAAQIALRSHYDNFIGGKWVAPVKGQYFDVITPISGKPYTKAARSGAEDIELALDAAHAAADKWGRTSPADRSNLLLKIADRIEAGTYMVAAAAAGGDVLIENAPLEDLEAVVAKLRATGVDVAREGNAVRVSRGEKRLRAVDVTTAPHPGFPTDMQAQFMVLMTLAEGTSRVVETIFENRFMHVPELRRMGATIDIDGHTAHVIGARSLSGAKVMATDLRASASLVIAGLIATEGETDVLRVYHLDRGYEHMERKLAAVGADTVRIHGEAG